MILAAPITYGQAIVLGLVQGVTELVPISSLGHSVILPQLLGWDIHQNDAYFITFLVATHLATALVLLGFFWQDWVRVAKGFLLGAVIGTPLGFMHTTGPVCVVDARSTNSR